MLGQRRDFSSCSIGRYIYVKSGRPTSESKCEWQVTCNFVFRVTHKIVNCSLQTSGKSWGWLMEVANAHHSTQELHIKCEEIVSSSSIKKFFMKHIEGAVCRLTNDEFLNMLQEDSVKGLPAVYVSEFCGKVECGNDHRFLWAFPNATLTESGAPSKEKILVFRDSLRKHCDGERFIIPSELPNVQLSTRINYSKVLDKLGHLMHEYYGPRLPHALHILSSVLKALHRDTIMSMYHQVSVTNVSGPANIGKTFACAIALKMMSSDSLMLSRCTPSALLDATHIFKNMLIVWDDPRDATSLQLCSIVHESFHGHANSTLSKGNRSYHSSLIIGTQDRLLGLPPNDSNTPTFTRLSHVDMHCDHEFRCSKESEHELQKHMKHLENMLPLLLDTAIEPAKVQKYYDRLSKKAGDVVDRALQIAALDWYLCDKLCKLGFWCPERDLAAYFENTQLEFLRKYCGRQTNFQKFCSHINQLLDSEIVVPQTMLKQRVSVELVHYGPKDCVAVHTKTFFDFLHKHIPESRVYTSDMIHSEIKNSKSKFGEVSKNVAYKLPGGGNVVQRSMLIRHDVLFD